jgi:hypothetical protein
MNHPTPMTKAERDELIKLVRRREKLAMSDVDRVAAERLADFEQQMASIYAPADDSRWAELHAQAATVVREADAALAERCRELRIPERFRPGLSLGWYERGENASAQRRAELRTVAKTRIDAMAKAAKVEVERQSIAVQTELVASGLSSGEARAFLATMPTAEVLVGAAPSVLEVEATTPHRDRYGRIVTEGDEEMLPF